MAEKPEFSTFDWPMSMTPAPEPPVDPDADLAERLEQFGPEDRCLVERAKALSKIAGGRDVLEKMRHAVVFIVEGGHADGARTRAAALACLLGLYAHPTEAAKRLNLCHSTVSRSLSDLRAKLSLCTHPGISNE